MAPDNIRKIRNRNRAGTIISRVARPMVPFVSQAHKSLACMDAPIAACLHTCRAREKHPILRLTPWLYRVGPVLMGGGGGGYWASV